MQRRYVAEMSKAKAFDLGARVQTGAGASVKHGTVAFVGETQFSTGEWVGLVLDGPDGKNDGSVAGVRYFECLPSFGLFVKAAQVKPSSAPVPSSTPNAAVEALPAPVQAPAPALPATPPPSSLHTTVTVAEKDTREKLAALREKRKARESSEAALNPLSELVSSSSTVPPPSAPSTYTREDQERLLARVTTLESLLRQTEERHKEELAVSKKDVERLEQVIVDLNGEQKKLAALQAKSSTVTNSTNELQKQIGDLNDTIEMLSLDKEQLSVDNELLEENQSKLNDKIAQLQAQLNDAKVVDQAKLSEENSKLREALSRLHEVSQLEKVKVQSSTRNVEELSKELTTLRIFKDDATTELVELRRSVKDSKSGDLEAMIESLSERNLALEERRKQLELTIHDLEAAHELMEELDGTQRGEIERLRKNSDALQIALTDRNRTIETLEKKIGETRIHFEAIAKTVNITKEESEDLRKRLMVNKEELEESSTKARTVSDLKVQVETLVKKLDSAERKSVNLEITAIKAKTTSDRMSKVFDSLALWKQELHLLSREVECLSIASKSSRVYILMSQTLLNSRATADAGYLVLAVLEGVRTSWTSAALVLMSSANKMLDTAVFADLFERSLAEAIPPVAKQIATQSVKSRCKSGASDIENMITLSFLLVSNQFLIALLPRIHDFDTSTADVCKTIAAELGTLSADKLNHEFHSNIEALIDLHESLLASLEDTPKFQASLSHLRRIKVSALSDFGTTFSIVNVGFLAEWGMTSSPLIACEWLSRVEGLRKECVQQDRDYKALGETKKALADLTLQYELRGEEATTATLRAEELRKMIGITNNTDEKGKEASEVKTLTEAIEVLELRNEALEKELKRLKASKASSIGGDLPSYDPFPGSNAIVGQEALAYWRRVATQRLVLGMPALCPQGVSRSSSSPATPGIVSVASHEDPSVVLSAYRSKRLERAAFRVRR